MIDARNINLDINNRRILHEVDISLREGDFVGLLGPNGAGKTSLMRAIMRFEMRATGQCNLWQMSPKMRAQSAAWLAQERFVAWDMRVEEVISLGRNPWHSVGQKHSDDRHQVDEAIKRMDLENFRHRRFQNLSGGERARVMLARALAQNTPILMADEPIAALDPANQIQAMQVLSQLAQEGRVVMISIHDLGLAARFCTKLALLHRGEMVAIGDANEVLGDANLRAVFGIEVYRAQSDGPIIQPIKVLEH